jgi:Rieske Fe-S protein
VPDDAHDDDASLQPSATRRIILGASAGAAAGAIAILAGWSARWSAQAATGATTAGQPTPAGTSDAARARPVRTALPAPEPPSTPASPSQPSPPSTPTSRSTAARPTGNGATGNAIAKVGDIPVGGGVIFAKENVVLTQPERGRFKAFNASCTHLGCTVALVMDAAIICGCHHSRFSIRDGSVQAGPAQRALEEKAVTVNGNDLVLG